MTQDCAIEADGLRKRYGQTTVLDGLDLQVPRASVLALLGPNGAGKTTAVRLLTTLTTPDGGRATVAGHDVVAHPARVRRAISLTGQYAALDELQTGAENLVMIGRLLELHAPAARARARELLTEFDLLDAADRRVGTYSGGMRRRLDLAASLVARPEVIFLDEPTTGLDPRSRQAMWALVAGLAGAGVTVLLTTQYLEEADQLADRIAVLDDGAIVAEGTAEELKEQVAGKRLDLRLADTAAFDRLSADLDGRTVHSDRSTLTLGLATDGAAAEVRALLDELDPDRRAIAAFSVHTATLEDVFMTLTGRPTDTTEREIAHV
jgi:ABC-2 type transport system ATP-binding protein